MPPFDPAAAVLTVDLDAIGANYRLLAATAPTATCAAIVKADAYGLGAKNVVPVLRAAGCNHFFVATLSEAIDLRPLAPDSAIYIFNGYMPDTAASYGAHGLTPVLNSLEQVGHWRDQSGGRAALHLDTGMSRLGLPPYEVEQLAADAALLDGIEPRWTISHLACSDEPEHPSNERQLALFNELRGKLPPCPAGICASSGIFLGPEFHLDLVRPGVALFGANPQPDSPNKMAEVIRLQGKILQARTIDSPMTVGYGAAHRASGPARIATVGVGYADGYARAINGCGVGVVGGIRVPVVGRVSMDLITLDVTDVPEESVLVGAPVSLIGDGISLEEVAEAAGTIPYEILTSLGRRYHRDYVSKAAT
jgi:alanine racemase